MKLIIRQANDNDHQQLLQWTQCLQAYEAEHGKAMLQVSDNIERYLEQWLKELQHNASSLILVAELDQKPAGFILGALLMQPNPFTVYQSHGVVQLLWVDEQYRQHAIASRLLEQISAVFKELGAGYIEIQHIAANVPAVNFWQKHGFEACGVIRRKFLN